MTEETITLPLKEYQKLKDAEFMLQCLHAGGVDNWEWYGESLQDGGYFQDED